MARKRYQGDGRCVYCTQAFPRESLTDEHIVPLALHGDFIIEKGACSKCAGKSNELYENKALQNDLLLPRLLLGLKGRRGIVTQDLRHLPAVFAGDKTSEPTKMSEGRLLNFPIELYPKFFHLLVFEPAGLLAGIDRGGYICHLRIQAFCIDGPSLNNLTINQPMINGPFATMLAKIGYCYAVAERSMEAFDGSGIRQLLTGGRSDVYNFVGSSSKKEKLTNRYLHNLYLRERDGWLIVLVHLFASLSKEKAGAIPYEVVVGKLI